MYKVTYSSDFIEKSQNQSNKSRASFAKCLIFLIFYGSGASHSESQTAVQPLHRTQLLQHSFMPCPYIDGLHHGCICVPIRSATFADESLLSFNCVAYVVRNRNCNNRRYRGVWMPNGWPLKLLNNTWVYPYRKRILFPVAMVLEWLLTQMEAVLSV